MASLSLIDQLRVESYKNTISDEQNCDKLYEKIVM